VLCVWLVAAVSGVLLMALPVGGELLRSGMILLLLAEGARVCRRLRLRRGTLERESVHCWIWQGKRWRPTQPLRWLLAGVLLVAKRYNGDRLLVREMQDAEASDE